MAVSRRLRALSLAGCVLVDADVESELSNHDPRALIQGLLSESTTTPKLHVYLTTESSLLGWYANPDLKQLEYEFRLLQTYSLGRLVTRSQWHYVADELRQLARPNALRKNRRRLKDHFQTVQRVACEAFLKRVVHRETDARTAGSDRDELRDVLVGIVPTEKANHVDELFGVFEQPELRTGASRLLEAFSSVYSVGRYPGADKKASSTLKFLESGTSPHSLMRSLEESVDLKSSAWDLVRLRVLHLLGDLGWVLVSGALSWTDEKDRSVCVLDDNYTKIEPHLRLVMDLFGSRVKIDNGRPDRKQWWRDLLRSDADPAGMLFEGNVTLLARVREYDVILIDMEYEGALLGPRLVRRLRNQLDLAGDARRPRIFVLSLSSDPEHVQQSLNWGADGYVLKTRMLSLPAYFAQSGDSECVTADWKSSFYSLDRLPPRVRSRLVSERIEGRESSKGGTSRDLEWIRRLPKSDLHCHIGTCISLEAIQAAALNTVGYMLANGRDTLALNCVKQVAKVVAEASKAKGQSDIDRLWSAIQAVCGCKGDYSKASALDSVVDQLHREAEPIARFETVSVIVACLAVAAKAGGSLAPWGFLRAFELCSKAKVGAAHQAVVQLGELARCATAEDAWNRGYSGKAVRETHAGDWEACEGAVRERTELAAEALNWALRSEGFDPEKPGKLPTLRDLVTLPAEPEQGDRTLLRYLWGAAFLGADHLQYPENLMLAASDLVRQAISDNIVYSELRCASLGYTAGGMSAVHATDILMAALDASVLCSAEVLAAPGQSRWPRFSILLAAKRHKSRDVPSVVSLLQSYLDRGGHGARQGPEAECGSPPYWKRSRVVGFDLSGDEKFEAAKFRKDIMPLLRRSANITIHAGEAASAESIWQAVHRLGARRIGHGLRLRESRSLMEYCVSEGICMELCPISNAFTNVFRDDAELPPEHRFARGSYPLRAFLDAGLDACINTDNRFLHAMSTLSDEYACAASMSGGLSRAELLKVIKAGFKHAFLPKSDVATLLRWAGNEIVEQLLLEDAEACPRMSR